MPKGHIFQKKKKILNHMLQIHGEFPSNGKLKLCEDTNVCQMVVR